ncbi:hypothetical protein R4E93_23405 [Bacteroides ovatus]|nr:hypothetical protein [Bacteroides ovatus]MDV7054557.1 hypothetical protein [Bacteroides ovatus]
MKSQKIYSSRAVQGQLVQQIAEEGTAEELLEQIKIEKHNSSEKGKLKEVCFD